MEVQSKSIGLKVILECGSKSRAAANRGRQQFLLTPHGVRQQFEGGSYSRAAANRGNTVYTSKRCLAEQFAEATYA